MGGFLPDLPSTSGPGPQQVATRGLATTRTGYVGNFFQTTMGPKWQFHKNMFLRPNLRFDWFDGVAANSNGRGGRALLPFADGTKNFQGILATDVVITY